MTVCFCDSRELATENHYVELCGTVQIAYGRKLRSISVYPWSYVVLSSLHTVGSCAVGSISVYPWSYVVLSRLHTVGTCAVYRFIQLRLTLTIARLIKLKVIVSLCFAGHR